MKIFWVILLAMVLCGGAYVVFKPGKGKDLVNAPPAAEIAPPMNRGVAGDESKFFETSTEPPASTGASATNTESNGLKPSPSEHETATTKPNASSKANESGESQDTASSPEASPKAATPAEKAREKGNQGLTKAEMAAAVAKAKDDAAKSHVKIEEASTDSSKAATPTTTVVSDVPEGVTIKKQDDGTVLVDDKFTLRGEGTEDHPYEITWDYLTSAEETYQPRLGKKTVPARLTMLNGKYIKISGYVAFPIMATEATEMLSMLNQWDGCCIGVPPTPYDAIEVKLKHAAEGEDRLASYGAVKGKFRVDPYLVKDWLVSLYMMDDGEVTRK